jgi:3-oxoacyl-[acyl-carrier protein] reductase
MNQDFDDRVVVVTGAAVGIGKATAAAFGNAGGTVYLVDIDADAGSASARAVENATFIHCDLTEEDEVAAAVEAIDQSSGRIDVLVNNAGGFPEALGLEDTSIEEWHRILDANLTSVFLMTRASLPLLRRSEGGRIVNLGSLAGQTAGWQTAPPYVAAKAGVHGLTRALATELAATAASIPLGRYQSPEEVAEWVLFLSSSAAGFMTGQTVSVNGGRFMA